MENMKKNFGISLTVLVIVIVVLIILAGASLTGIIGNNGIIGKSKDSSIQVYIDKIIEDAKMAYKDVYEERNEDIELGATVTTFDIAAKMIEKYRLYY